MCLAGRICRLFTLGTGACDCEAQQNDDDAEMELDYRPGNYQVPLSSP